MLSISPSSESIVKSLIQVFIWVKKAKKLWIIFQVTSSAILNQARAAAQVNNPAVFLWSRLAGSLEKMADEEIRRRQTNLFKYRRITKEAGKKNEDKSSIRGMLLLRKRIV